MIPGILLRHFKGGRYVVLHQATSTESSSVAGGVTPVVVYMSLKDGRIWVRPEEQFIQVVDWPDGEKRHRFIVDSPDGTASEPCLIRKGLGEPHIVSEPLKALDSEELARLALQANVPVRTAYVWLTSGRVALLDASQLEAAYKELFEEKK